MWFDSQYNLYFSSHCLWCIGLMCALKEGHTWDNITVILTKEYVVESTATGTVGTEHTASKTCAPLLIRILSLLPFPCSMSCQNTGTCNVNRTSTVKEYHCCDGFTTKTSKHSYLNYWYRESAWYLKKYGCPRSKRHQKYKCFLLISSSSFFQLPTPPSLVQFNTWLSV